MPLNPSNPLICLITSGKTNVSTTPASNEFTNILKLVEAAVTAGVDLVQLREKDLHANVLYELALRASGTTKGSATKLLLNDRADVAAGSGADGVHLTRRSLPAGVVRGAFGHQFLIGVSTHSLEEARAACDEGADFVVFGPVFDVASKREYGEPLGINSLQRVTSELSPFPVLALGGVTANNAAACLKAGARGVAAIRMLEDPLRLSEVVEKIRKDVRT